MNTTLNQIRDESPCADGWKKLLAHLGKTQADDEALSIITILNSNGLDDALWCLRAVKGHDREIRLYAAWCAKQVQHLMIDQRSIDALDVAERYANGLATEYELNIARAAAKDAACAVARHAACDAAIDAAQWAAACDAAWAAQWAAAKDAQWDVAIDAQWDVARDAQAKRLREVCEIDNAVRSFLLDLPF